MTHPPAPSPAGRDGPEQGRAGPGVDLYWIPLGAGTHVMRLSGRLYEALVAARGRRPRRALYHSALIVHLPEGDHVIEMAPIPAGEGPERGVVAEGPVGTRWAGRFRLLRYEVRCWPGGRIPDVAAAVDSPHRVTDDAEVARAVLDLASEVPTPVWGRDELHLGEMWSSNSVIAWLLVRAGISSPAIGPPTGGRAPGWDAGLAAGHRSRAPAAGGAQGTEA